MLFGKKEEKVERLILDHFLKIKESLEIFKKVIREYVEKTGDFTETSYALHKAEHEADDIRRSILKLLSGGAFLPFYREDYITLTEMVDKIAGRAVDISKSLVLEEPVVPEGFQGDIILLSEEISKAFELFFQAISCLASNSDKIYELTEKVSEHEQKADSIEWKLQKRLFHEIKMDRVEKLIIRDTIKQISNIADQIENASDKLEVLVSKQFG